MTTHHTASKELSVNGIVQGVGFRPFIYQLARRFHLNGDVANTSNGVLIHIEGDPGHAASFCETIEKNPPPLSKITQISISDAPKKGFSTFSIIKSHGDKSVSTLISPDVSVCKDCLSELFDPNDRRHGYPFLNCVNCGPRYTIIDDIPYDRPNTSMKWFEMCEKCRDEYEAPENRRFHAQPNACPNCGPQVSLYTRDQKKIPCENPVEKTAELLKQGHILAIKGLGGFHLAVDATNDSAVKRLRRRKGREEKPLALMSLDLDAVREYAHVRDSEKTLLTSIERPIVMLKKKEAGPLSRQISPKNGYFGVMLPYTPLHYLIVGAGFTALVMTSGNITEEPIVIDNDTAFLKLEKIADYFLIHDRDIYLRSDDSIVRHAAGSTRFVRRSRGYAPSPIFLKKSVPPILACGAHMKNVVCLAKGKNAFLSQHIGDLENRSAHAFFQMTIEHMKQIFDIPYDIVACDLHPGYMSSQYAAQQQETGATLVSIQHHHAHIASCMAENQIDSTVIGVALDGTGFGTDGAAWGGEVMIADLKQFQRKASISYVPMPGGASAIKEPWRMAVSYLYDAFGDDFTELGLGLMKTIGKSKMGVLTKMMDQKINSPLTSSAGRLFDGVASIIGLRSQMSFEGQAAMELEMLAGPMTGETYPFEWTLDGNEKKLPTAPIIRGVVGDIEQGVDRSVISAKFHQTIIRAFSDACHDIGRESGIDRVALSGGAFQNRLLLKGMIQELEKKGFRVFTHTLAPCNDGGLSLGQVAIAAQRCAAPSRSKP